MAVGPTRRKRKLGAFMRQLRTQYDPNLKPETVAELAECARPSVVRMETGVSLPRKHLFRVILGIYEPSEADRTRAMKLWAHADADAAVIEHADGLVRSYRAFRQDEADAVLEQNYQPMYLPGIAQTDRYVAALSTPSGEDEENADSAHAAERRTRRDQLYPPRSLQLHMLLDEAVVRRCVGDKDVMVEQLEHLLTLGGLANVTIQIIPFGAGAYRLAKGPVVILSFDDEGEQSRSVYLESHVSSQTVENEDDVQGLAEAFAEGCGLALSPVDSAAMIRQQIEVYQRGV